MNPSSIKHASVVELDKVTFAVQPAGRAKVIEQKRKNVHAYVRGDLVKTKSATKRQSVTITADYRLVTYNPYKYDSFVLASNETPVVRAEHAIIIGKLIYARGLTTRPMP